MDESELDRDIVIQRYSADLIADFDSSLGPFLRKPNGQLRTRVREKETLRLVTQVLEPFQELPQLLDPHLPKYLPILAEAYLEQIRNRHRTKSLSLRSQLLTPLSNAISRIIYTFCKIRGEKVVVRFLSVETKYLEPLLYAIEDADRRTSASRDGSTTELWTWHERYVILLWLSQLFFAPFDLSTISSGDIDEAEPPDIPGFQWPSRVPGITLRVIPLAIKYLASPGKERDGAKALLVRLAMRRDMQEIGILQALVHWALSTLHITKDNIAETPYHYIGSLALLAGILRSSADTSIMNPHLASIFYAVQKVSSEENELFEIIKGSALARKMMIKVVRSVIILVLRKTEPSREDTEMVETSIGYLLESLADNDTPVRFAASKALSMITLKLESDMALQVVEAVLESLNRNVLWVKSQLPGSTGRIRDLTAVDALEWHGLMLTLSHLLYRRSPPPETLSDIIHALIMGLSFEKRGTAGGSFGTNVRDAACFGIWAVARRYTTEELLQVPTRVGNVIHSAFPSASVIQTLATELVIAASLDPAGNIRRGSSAALQELIGRHPDIVSEGIAVVQTADYHAVALRSRAIHDVALQATRLSTIYGVGLREALLSWRGIGDADAMARRVAGTTFGLLTAVTSNITSDPLDHFNQATELLLNRIRLLQTRQVEERHGLLLSLAATFDILPELVRDGLSQKSLERASISRLLDALVKVLEECTLTTYRKPELIAEASARLVTSSFPILLLGLMTGHTSMSAKLTQDLIQTGRTVTVDSQMSTKLLPIKSFLDGSTLLENTNIQRVVAVLSAAVFAWLNRSDAEVIDAAAPASTILLLFSPPEERPRIIQRWIDIISDPKTSRQKHGDGIYFALTQAYHISALLSEDKRTLLKIPEAFRVRWALDGEIETHVAIIRSLVGRDMLRYQVLDFVPIISAGLDDYTTNARGDIGSHVRLEAIKATRTLWESCLEGCTSQSKNEILGLFPKVLRLAAEKLDRVRVEAQAALTLLLAARESDILKGVSFSSRVYFVQLFDLCNASHLLQNVAGSWPLSEFECVSSLLAGLATSADTGNEDLVIASRAAIAEVCKASSDNLAKICMSLIHNLKIYQGQDRVIVPTLELIAYLFHIGSFQQCREVSLRQLCLLTQKAGYKTGNVRKLEACVKVYGGIASTTVDEVEVKTDTGVTSDLELKRKEGIAESRRRLGALLSHPWPRVKTLAIDELWGLLSSSVSPETSDESHNQHVQAGLLSVDWGQADKMAIKTLVENLGFN
ncbi:tubulin folding cofactor D C terminal-domain-containing protein [Truncatella angustata]|uniref:Tubulin folding cofactor D C terminal-domain-containing protein n=1 Tax=Truncatella angustata TaxID=152316 RepID=A0A9P8UWS5_9PEZI|nr:tubulin folding cofactor D C terminal-domain-containing protein [Truncatella angustata]KAH6659800.1 tubulin folding cofactor D C terminal-domain-containing protein [Truncatella angustata]